MGRKQKKMRKSNLLRGSLIVLAALMLLCGTYLVTLAYLQEDTDEVNNTFFPVGLATKLELVEKDPKDNDGNGLYDDALTNTEVTQEAYLFAPGVTLKKQPYVKITDLKENAYLFVEYTGALAGMKQLVWDLDAEGETAYWRLVTNTSGRLIYVYVGPQAATSGGILTPKTSYTIDIIRNDSVYTSPDIYDITNPTAREDYVLNFSAYLVQATGFADYQTAWNSTYGK